MCMPVTEGVLFVWPLKSPSWNLLWINGKPHISHISQLELLQAIVRYATTFLWNWILLLRQLYTTPYKFFSRHGMLLITVSQILWPTDYGEHVGSRMHTEIRVTGARRLCLLMVTAFCTVRQCRLGSLKIHPRGPCCRCAGIVQKEESSLTPTWT